MEFAIPLAKCNPENIKIEDIKSFSFRKILPIEYTEGKTCFKNLIISLPPLKVREIHLEKNQVTLEESEETNQLQILEKIQEKLLTFLEINYTKWFHEIEIRDVKKIIFQPWINSKRITLFLPSNTTTFSYFTENGQSVFSSNSLKPGEIVRAFINIHGLCLQLLENNNWTGRSRIQHKTLHLYKILTPLT
jgi:hypothetical protein